MTNEELKAQYEARANAERSGGGVCVIDNVLPTVFICTGSGDEYFFQEHEASDLIDSVPEWINAEDFLLATSQNW